MFTTLRLFIYLSLLMGALGVRAADPRIAQELADDAPIVIPLREALGKKLYDEAMASGKYYYIGSRSCRVCHRDFYNGRKDDRHFHSFKKFADSGYAKEPRCLACHTTGYGVPTGFADENRHAELKGVQCEGCHGPGNVHMARNDGGGFLAGVDHPERIKKMCLSCHNARWNKAFNAKEFEQVYDGYITAKPGDEKPSYYNY